MHCRIKLKNAYLGFNTVLGINFDYGESECFYVIDYLDSVDKVVRQRKIKSDLVVYINLWR